ncbi:BREX-1 system phosphatase PglZ type A [Amphibacillus indicireducens]|uniref:BREX-1 system phosphatase PglZ type A n=2 Tax=Amphibacillus indicireducens TaxID=1076330 RepID=A0ABP7VVF0_9BACI
MMKLKEVHRNLNEIFNQKLTNHRRRHIVFWYDEQGEFKEDFEEIQLDHVRKWILTKNNLFATKYELEKNDPDSHFLIYANFPKPLPREDWLYDQLKLGHEFATDKTTNTMRELGVNDDSLRIIFKHYQPFFNNNQRTQAFHKFKVESYTEEIVDLTVLATLVKSPINTLDEVLKTIFRKHLAGDHSTIDSIRKYGDETRFWALIEKYYAYVNHDKSINTLLTFLILTYLNEQNHGLTIPVQWEGYIGKRITNIVVFIDQWMNHRTDRLVYNELSDQISSRLNVDQVAQQWDIHVIKDLDSFQIFDQLIINFLVEQLIEDLSDYDFYSDLLVTRRRLHWYQEYQHEYEAIFHALKLKQLLHELNGFIPEQPAIEMFMAYADHYFQIDQAYRKFYLLYDQVENKDRIRPLQEKVENLYVNQFIEDLALKWTASLKQLDHLNWPINGIKQQQHFYQEWVKPYQEQGERVFVIISDALRYEVGKELIDVLNNERKASTEITAVQGVLPSYTRLGMATLLPYRELEYLPDGRLFVDGKNSASMIERGQILAEQVEDSLVASYQDLMGLNRTKLRETLLGKTVVYIYHNTIDARGDHATTEGEVFSATEEAINDIRLLVNRLVTDISASNILITADHGFLYQRDQLVDSQKLPNKVDQALMTKRRYALMNEAIELEGTLTYSLDYLLNQNQELFVTVPKGINRFAIQGSGANYVHGGAMLQEIVLPVIAFKNDRSKSLKNLVKKVDVKITTPSRKITSPITFLEFLQIEKVADKRLPRRLLVYFEDEQGNRVSSENIIIADRTIAQVGERTYREKFVFKSEQYDKRKNYYLVLIDEETEKEYERYTFSIDITL